MKKVYCNGKLIWDSVSEANTVFSRFRGLMGKPQLLPNQALLITPCNQVHTFHMRFPIDIIYLSKYNEVLGISTLPPRRIGQKVKGAHHVLEAASGSAAKNDVAPGDKLIITQI